MSKWLLIDGFNLAYRCFFAIPELNRADGFPTNAVHGWVKSIWRLTDQERPDGVLVFFDLGGAQDRLALLPDYKAQRAEMPDALQQQIPILKELTKAMGLVGVEQNGVESDDLLASEAVALAGAGHDVLVVSSDKDFAQIVNERIRILLPPPSANPKLGWRTMDAGGVVEKFGVSPTAIADYLALVGDASDNIPGLPGVGPKTAVKWLLEYGSLDGLLAAAASVKPDRFRELIPAKADDLIRNRKLTTLNLALPVQTGIPVPPDVDAILRILESMEMRGALAEARRRYSQAELF